VDLFILFSFTRAVFVFCIVYYYHYNTKFVFLCSDEAEDEIVTPSPSPSPELRTRSRSSAQPESGIKRLYVEPECLQTRTLLQNLLVKNAHLLKPSSFRWLCMHWPHFFFCFWSVHAQTFACYMLVLGLFQAGNLTFVTGLMSHHNTVDFYV